jgi:hypothetical protein
VPAGEAGIDERLAFVEKCLLASERRRSGLTYNVG